MASSQDNPRDLALKVLGAGAAGVGTLGLIAGAGGAIMFERFSQAGLPAEQAVATQPKTVLLAVGAEALIPLAATMLVVLAAYWILAKSISTWLFAVVAALGAIFYYLLVVSFAFKLHVLTSVIVVTVVACGLWALLAGRTVNAGVRALMLAVATAVLGCAIGLIRTIDAPKVRGAVVVLTNPSKVVAGIYVAETSEQVYLGQVELADSYDDRPAAGSGAIIALSRKDISTVALASNQGLATALRQASLMAMALKEEPDGTSVAARLAETRRQRVSSKHPLASRSQAKSQLRPSEAIDEQYTLPAPPPKPSEEIYEHASSRSPHQPAAGVKQRAPLPASPGQPSEELNEHARSPGG